MEYRTTSSKNLNKCLFLFNPVYCFETFITNVLHNESLYY